MLFKLLSDLARKAFGWMPERPPAPIDRPSAGDEAPSLPMPISRKYVWQRLRDPGEVDYYAKTGPRKEVVELLAFDPRFALDVGCAAGAMARHVKDTFPKCKVWGVEPNAKAAEVARTRIDKVIVGSLESIDWAAHGVSAGEVDTVFLLDVMEHMYDPWHALATLRNFVDPRAQVVISLPNVRNIMNVRDLMNGYWRYRDVGLMDSTHIRFFTEYEALRLIYQTGFRVEHRTFTLSGDTEPLYAQMEKLPFPQTVTFENGTLAIRTMEELESFAALQFIFLVRPARREELDAKELALAEQAHPQTFAMGGEYPGVI